MNQPNEDVWPGWIPTGVPTYVAAPRAVGTSYLLADWIARVTRGGVMPDGQPTRKGLVVTVTEDSPDTVSGEVFAAGGDRGKLLCMPHGFHVPGSLGYLSEILAANDDARLVVIDSLNAVVDRDLTKPGGQPMSIWHEITRPLARLAAERQIGLVVAVRVVKATTAQTGKTIIREDDAMTLSISRTTRGENVSVVHVEADPKSRNDNDLLAKELRRYDFMVTGSGLGLARVQYL